MNIDLIVNCQYCQLSGKAVQLTLFAPQGKTGHKPGEMK